KAGLKVTLPRVKILQILENTEQRHLTAEDVYRTLLDAGEDVGIATVYRVLTQFESAGLVVRHNFDNGPAVYEHAKGDLHDLMGLTETGDVIEFHNEQIETLQRQIADSEGYEVVGHSQVLYIKPVKPP